MNNKSRYFSKLLPEMANRSKYATVGRLAFSNPALRSYLLDTFSAPFGTGGSFLADPVFEATFGWKASGVTMASLAGNLLSNRLVEAMDNPPPHLRKDYRFAKDAVPYDHQLMAWNHLSSDAPQSLVVTSGTGSGKTECFMVPILDRCVREVGIRKAPLVGVRALFLYPLNALINSQQDRLQAWTHAFGKDIRFCLYNGNTPDTEKEAARAAVPNQVIDRETLRASPPPVLVTNATMLEYMLVRSNDAPILDKSKGMLEWIVLDEAHSYIGSQAAELALLLRRVLHAFGVRAGQVRFVATSATIGDPNGAAGEKLRSFLAGLAGVPVDHVHVVGGERAIPPLPAGDQAFAAAGLDVLQNMLSTVLGRDEQFMTVASNITARRIRERFTRPPDGRPVAKLSELVGLIDGGQGAPLQEQQRLLLEWLDVLTAVTRELPGGRQEPFLPLRAHMFHQVLGGLWACADPACKCKQGTKLDDKDWPYGLVYLEKRKHCLCGAPVFEVQSCGECNQSYLAAFVVSRPDGDYLEAGDDEEVDEFALEAEPSDDEPVDAEVPAGVSMRSPAIIATGWTNGTSPVRLGRADLRLEPSDDGDAILLRVCEEQEAKEKMALKCPCCGAADTAKRLLRRPILGAPFLLGQVIPTLLEFCEDGDQPLNKPYRGKRMITFTDSRQGTARIAAKIQQESERNRLRGLVLGKVARAIPEDTPEAIAIKAKIEAYRPLLGNVPGLEAMVKELEGQLAQAQPSCKPIPFDDMAAHLGTNEKDIERIFNFYKAVDPAMFEASPPQEFAKMALAREFARRPSRANNAETMGMVMVQYPGIQRVSTVPPDAGLALQDWRDFLKLCLDYFVRDNTCVDLPVSWKKWSGNKLSRKYLLSPTYKDAATGSYTRWPQVSKTGRQHRLVRLLAYALKLDPASPAGADKIDVLLRKAWDDLLEARVLDGSGSTGYYLPFSAMAFATIGKAWVCPVTRRILDTTLKGVTPFLPRESPTAANSECRPLAMPQCPVFRRHFDSDEARLDASREWLSTSAEVTQLRSEGLWTDLNDRAVDGAAYFRAAEHSAQQPARRLAEYEKLFKIGQLNLLSCSTTMEMGVDIGGISVVAMNNVPPHPANYLQRAGRAGRRSETRAVALTVCKNNPHDQAVFANTRWPFDTTLPLPGISLSSAAIVQRHLNSMLLSHFLRTRAGAAGADLNKLDCEWFFLPAGGSLADAFCNWTETFREGNDPHLDTGLRFLVRNTCFDGIAALSSLAQVAAREMQQVSARWSIEYTELTTRMAPFTSKASQLEAAFKALQVQRARLASEYLLSELATEGFLPTYGFPMHIAPFDTLNIEEIRRSKAAGPKREDNRMRHRDLPSRDLVTALREYAPGADVVMDGLVYRSAGITLNWHAPASKTEVREIQNIRLAWRCKYCGASGTEPNIDHSLHCAECGRGVPSDHIRKYLEPAGFAVDLYADVHNDVTQQQYIKPQAPWIHVQQEWTPLPNPALGRYRSSPGGSAFFHSSGLHENGYAICLKCGRAEPHEHDEGPALVTNGHLPPAFRHPHKALRGRKGGDSALCPGSDEQWSIITNVHLGHEVRTDVLELQLKGTDGHYMDDEPVAFTLAVALRGAIARHLGVQADELGCATKEVRVEGNALCRSIIIFDNDGSGYVTAVHSQMGAVLKEAISILHCERNCEGACPHCLDGYGTRFQHDLLNRQAALAFLTDAWIRNLQLPREFAYFGPQDSRAEYQPLPEAIWRELTKPASSGVAIYMHGDASSWDLPASSLRSYLYRWIGKEKPVQLVLSEDTLSQLSVDNKRVLGAWAGLGVVKVKAYKYLPAAGDGVVLAAVSSASGTTRWAVQDEAQGTPGPGWGQLEGKVLVAAHSVAPHDTDGRLIEPQEFLGTASSANSYRIDLADQLNGPIQGFGGRFWNRVFDKFPELAAPIAASGGRIASISYADRYLNSPLPVALLVEVVNALKTRFVEAWQTPTICITTVPLPAKRDGAPQPRFVWSDWTSNQERAEALKSAFAYCGVDGVEVHLTHKHDAEHARSLEVTMEGSGGLVVHFDQGLSYWKAKRTYPNGMQMRNYANEFDFSQPPTDQGTRIAEMSIDLSNPNYPTYLYVNLS